MPKVYRLHKEQQLPISLNQAWKFVSNPENLKTITPPDMGFEIMGKTPHEMFQGQIIEYTVKPMLNIPTQWVTEITHVNEPNFFVDEQRFGPYAFWHHKHFLEEIPNGVKMKDEIHYALPLGLIGRIANHLLVSKQLEKIFAYRTNKLKQLFPANQD